MTRDQHYANWTLTSATSLGFRGKYFKCPNCDGWCVVSISFIMSKSLLLMESECGPMRPTGCGMNQGQGQGQVYSLPIRWLGHSREGHSRPEWLIVHYRVFRFLFSFSRACSEPKYLSFAVLGWPGMKITNSAWSATTVGGMNTEAIAGGTRCVVKKTRGAWLVDVIAHAWWRAHFRFRFRFLPAHIVLNILSQVNNLAGRNGKKKLKPATNRLLPMLRPSSCATVEKTVSVWLISVRQCGNFRSRRQLVGWFVEVEKNRAST